MKPLHSVITTSPREAFSQTGTQLGEHGSATRENSRLVEWLAQRSPGDVDKAAVSQASRRGVTLDVQRDFRVERDEHGNRVSTHTPVKSVAVRGSLEARAVVKVELERLMVPAPEESLEAWLAELSVITSRRQDDEFTETLRLTAYAKRLAKYPADVARAALLDHPWKFWPAWVELEKVCEREVAARKAMIAALDREDEPQPQEARARVSAERAAEIMREVFGDRA